MTSQDAKTTSENCPLCSEANDCANSSSCKTNQGCWCMGMDITFPENLLNKVPSADKNKSCICKPCLLKHNKQN